MRYYTMAGVALICGLSALCVAAQTPQADKAGKTALDDYIQKPDPEFKWTWRRRAKAIPRRRPSSSSPRRRGAPGGRRPPSLGTLARHRQAESLKTNKVFLMVTGGNNLSKMPEAANPLIAQIAEATGSIVAELHMVPNQPLVFHGDGKGRSEDDLIAYAWDQFLKTGDATWVPRLPMVKSVVRAMDCIQEWAKTQGITVEGFVVAGGSKRGWTTWMTAAVDAARLGDRAHRHRRSQRRAVDAPSRRRSMAFGRRRSATTTSTRSCSGSDHPRMKDLHRDRRPVFLPGPVDDAQVHRQRFRAINSFAPIRRSIYFDDLPGEKLLRVCPERRSWTEDPGRGDEHDRLVSDAHFGQGAAEVVVDVRERRRASASRAKRRPNRSSCGKRTTRKPAISGS